MSIIELRVPVIGEYVTEVTLSNWLKENGSYVEQDESICEFESDKATIEAPAEKSGTLIWVAREGDNIPIGGVYAKIDSSSVRANTDFKTDISLNFTFMKLQNYNVISKLGEGGMATVFLAEDKKFQTQVALKVLNKDLAHNENIRKRFLAEARNMYKMSHPNIIKVTDLIDEGDTVAFVMEHIDGETLKEYLDRKGKLTDDEIRNIFSQMLDAVGYVHEQGLVHRDIKPSNFMIDKKGKVKLLDFGIAKNTDSTSAEYTQTGTGMQMGTPMYMSPEQITETKSVTPQSDIYSLGVVLWQLVTGEKPYNTATLSNFQLQTKIVNEPLPAMGSSFDGVIKKATEKDPSLRFTDCNEFKKALENKTSNTGNEKTVFYNSDEKTILNRSQEKTVVQKPTLPSSFTDEFGIEFILVEAGTFMMGANTNDTEAENNEKPAHQVTLTESYYIGKYPVTQAQWEKIMGSNPSYFESRPNCPVECVSWDDCQEFIQKLNSRTGRTYRLPTEAEWEYAARGGNKSRGYKFAGSNNLDEVGWYAHNSCIDKTVEKKTVWGFVKTEVVSECCTHDVGQKKANELGIHDMSGNVWERCSGWFSEYNAIAMTNPQGASNGSFRVLRGGSWLILPQWCRVAFRNLYIPDFKDDFNGFRLALVP